MAVLAIPQVPVVESAATLEEANERIQRLVAFLNELRRELDLVSYGAADSGGAGFKTLRVEN